MDISQELANKIIDSIKDIIDQDINFMNKSGIIIASTDKDRIGDFHEAALKTINQKRTITIDRDNQYMGAKKGINLPIDFNNQTVAVIGITGTRNKVERYGQITKKMTEILIMEEYLLYNSIRKRDASKTFIEKLINNKLSFDETIYDINKDTNKFIAVSYLPDSILDNFSTSQIINVLESLIDDDNLIFTISHDQIILFIYNINRTLSDKILKKIQILLKREFNCSLKFGVSNVFFEIDNSKKYYSQAQASYEWVGNVNLETDIYHYGNMTLGLILSDLDDSSENIFINKVLKDIKNNDYDFYNNLLLLYGKFNGSINKIADELFMHKNSIQYRLNKMKEITGYDPRKFDDYVILKLAFLLFDKKKKGEK